MFDACASSSSCASSPAAARVSSPESSTISIAGAYVSEQRLEHGEQVVVDARFAHVVARAGLPDLEHPLLVVVAADRDDRQAAAPRASCARRLDAVEYRHLDVDHDRVHIELACELDALLAVACARDREAPVGAEERFQSGAEIVVVFGDEDPVGPFAAKRPTLAGVGRVAAA